MNIVLSNGLVAAIDECDAEIVGSHNWFAWPGRHTTYAATSIRSPMATGGKCIKMHRLILGLLDSDRRVVVDHRDGNGLNNTRSNLKICTIAENLHGVMRGPRGVSEYRGVSWSKAANKWESRISVRGVRRSLGFFASEVEAAIAYNAAKLTEFGADSELNSIP